VSECMSVFLLLHHHIVRQELKCVCVCVCVFGIVAGNNPLKYNSMQQNFQLMRFTFCLITALNSTIANLVSLPQTTTKKPNPKIN